MDNKPHTLLGKLQARIASALAQSATPTGRARLDELNRNYIKAITRPDATQAEHQQALHAYLTSPLRDEPVECYCTTCRAERTAQAQTN